MANESSRALKRVFFYLVQGCFACNKRWLQKLPRRKTAAKTIYHSVYE
ncbi:hypothetical protein COLO4_10476 [Corchorus olitorius]|uniref:Uncharacterized protein n=1 Tax=Corchorus olitorius TaxID=93759 RepID=A0A1R3K8B2_9ROSI|nr:hypothetical protein COLO4_10476 [Corchorus olitorius]